MLPLRFTLISQIAGVIDPNEDDIIYSDIDVSIEGRNQEVGNCWSYPSLNSIETSAISQGLVSDPSEIEGSEWHLSLYHTGMYPKGLAINETNDNPLTIPALGGLSFGGFDLNFGGHSFFATSYFASGKSGAFVSETKEERALIADTVDKAKKYYGLQGKQYKLNKAEIAALYQDPNENRMFSYETGITFNSMKKAKRYMHNENISAYVSFSNNDALGFHDYLNDDRFFDYTNDKQVTSIQGKPVKSWISPSSLELVDNFNEPVSLNVLFKAALSEGAITSSLYQVLSSQFKNKSVPGQVEWKEPDVVTGGGHAVTAIGWDDEYVAPKVNYFDKVLNYLFSSISTQSQNKNIEKQKNNFNAWVEAEGYSYTNTNQRSKGAWLIQNSWGQGENEFQYLPYNNVANEDITGGVTFHTLDNTGILGNVDSSAVLPPIQSLNLNDTQTFNALGYRFENDNKKPIAALGIMNLQNPSRGSMIQASIYKLGELDSDPVISSNVEKQIAGYQTLRFKDPIMLDSKSKYVAVIEQVNNDKKSNKDGLHAFEISDIDQIYAASQSNSKPDQAAYYHNLPSPYLDVIKTSTSTSNGKSLNTLASDVYYAKGKDEEWFDLGSEGSVFMLNVVYKNQNHIVSDVIDTLTGTSASDRVFLNDRGNNVSTRGGDDIVHANASHNVIKLGRGNDILIATEAKGNKLVVDGGSGSNKFVYSMGEGSQFAGKSTIKSFSENDQILLFGHNDKSLNISSVSKTMALVSSTSFQLEIFGDNLENISFIEGVISIT